MKNLFNYHYDFIKLKLYDVDTEKVNWDVLKPHPHLKNHYTLISIGLFEDKNFDLFIDKGKNVTIRTSLPYLCYGHNYTSFQSEDMFRTLSSLSDLLGLDLLRAVVLELEFGAYQKIDISAKEYIKKISGLVDYEIEKSTDTMKMFGDRKQFHFKIYDPIANSKIKKTFSASNYPKSDLLKYEVKMTEMKLTNGKKTDAFHFCHNKVDERSKKILKQHSENIVFIDGLTHFPEETTMNHLLFTSLKNLEQQSGINAYSIASEVINQMDLSPSQRSKRRKSLENLETKYNNQVLNKR